MSQSMQVGSFQWMKSLNKSIILNVIRLHGPISRAEIAKLTKLTPPTVTNIVAELLETRIVVESELGESTGGRKPIMLRINSTGIYVIGVYAGAKKVKAVTANLDGKVIRHAEQQIRPQPTADEFLQTVKDTVHRVLEETQVNKESFLGIGVGMHGLVNPEQGISLFAPNLNLRNIAIKSALQQEFKLPVEVENDVRALALGESWFGQGQGISNFICINVGTGVGAGIILDHQLYHGTSYTAGEIGHTTIDINGPRCSCGNYGCLESLVAGPAIAVRAGLAIRVGKKSVLEDWVNGMLDQITGEMVNRAANDGDAVAIEILVDTGRYLGIGIANVINTLNPSRIILSGGVSKAGRFLLESVKETVQSRALSAPAANVSIGISELGEHAHTIGAITVVLNTLFTPTRVGEV